ncbi:MAG: HD domain-containing phosphohydrolase, partial [Desulfofustis sp.]
MAQAVKRKSFPLRIHISTLFIVLMLIACGSISILFYLKSRDMVARETENRVDRIVSESTRELERLFGPPETLASLLAQAVITRAETLEQRLDSLSVLKEAIAGNPAVASVYFGYRDGDFFQFRRLQAEQDREFFGAPDQTTWLVQSIDNRSKQTSERKMIFYDWELKRQLGITFARSLIDEGVVAGVDVRLETLSEMMKQFKITPGTRAILFETSGQLIAYEDPRLLVNAAGGAGQINRRRIDQLGEPAMEALAEVLRSQELTEMSRTEFEAEGEPWLSTNGQLRLMSGPPIYFSMAVPFLELTAEVRQIRNQAILIALGFVLALIPITLMMARVISKPISKLADDAKAVSRLDFSEREHVSSIISEVDQLSGAMSFMRTTISEFLALIESLNREKNFDTLLERIGSDVRHAAASTGVLICLIDEEKQILRSDAYCDSGGCRRDLELPDLALDEDLPIVQAVKKNERLRWELSGGQANQLAGLIGAGDEKVTIWCQPLEDRQDTSMGVLGLVYVGPGNGTGSSELGDRLSFVERLSGLAGVTLETKQLIKKQKELFDAFIKLIAGAIDAKSPYTGGHCQRVPEIAKMLAQAACDEQQGPLADFDLTDEQWEELHVAAWLHDCGKVTTPEFVVDKATKLETIYDRIHEVRMRFEVLKRDAEISCWQAIADGSSKTQRLDDLKETLTQLDEDFDFIARCNEGGEFLADEAIERLSHIAKRTWTRTLDDRIGISWEEAQRKNRTAPVALPAVEQVLTDKEEHLISRTEKDNIAPDNPWGFKLDVPESLYNRGEVYNLAVRRGTLSLEERFKINDHIVQTIKMLEELPYPKHLLNVPEIAGGHHETLHGTGYPRKLTGDQMSITAKMMVIADVFEALTASDR